jgi:Heparinase II/III-like protein/Heparinase II/III N-terminus
VQIQQALKYTTKTMLSGIRIAQIYLFPGRHAITAEGQCVFAPPGRGDLRPRALELPLNWNMDPYKDRNWCAQLHMWRMIDDYLVHYEKTEDPSWLYTPLDLIEDYANYHLIQGRRSRLAWKDMMVGLRAMKLAYIMSLHQCGKIELSAARLQACAVLVERHAAFLSDTQNIKYSNHTFIDLHGAKALCQVTDGAIRTALELVVADVLPKLLRLQFSPSGVHLENSPKYHLFGMSCLHRLRQSGWFADHALDELYARAKRIKTWMYLPDGRLAPIGDTAGSKLLDGNLAADNIQQRRGVLNESGYVVIQQAEDPSCASKTGSYLFFMGAFNSVMHKHQDDLSFIWFERQDILCDAGQYAYESDDKRAYISSTRAHNTVEIENGIYDEIPGCGQRLPYGSAIREVKRFEWGYVISGQIKHSHLEIKHSRALLYHPKQWVVVIDKLDSIEEHLYTQWFHFCPSISLILGVGNQFQTTFADQRRLVVTSASDKTLSKQLVRGQTSPRLQGWISRGYRDIEQNDSIGISCRGSTAHLVTILVINDSGSECAVDDSGELSINIRTTDLIETRALSTSIRDDGCVEMISHSLVRPTP